MHKTPFNTLSKTYTYSEYRALIKDLLKRNLATGSEQSDERLHFSQLNDKRMDRLDKTVALEEHVIEKLQSIQQNQTWLVLCEGWCGDAAQNVPVIAKMASVTDKIDLQIVLRDDNLTLMDQFLTNGARAIPKLIVIDDKQQVMNTWGPRPSIATKMVADYKKEHGQVDAQLKENLQVWYNKNKGVNLQEDILAIL